MREQNILPMVTFLQEKEYFDAIIKWHKTRNGIEGLEPKHIGYENGVLGGVVSALMYFARKVTVYCFILPLISVLQRA